MALFDKKKKATNPDRKVLTAQIIQDDFFRFLSYMPNPDDVALGTKGSYQTYRDMKTDPRIKSLLDMIKTEVLNFPMRFVQGPGVLDEVHAFVTTQPIFSTQRLYQKAKRMLAAVEYGFSVTEEIWKEEAGALLLDNLITRKPERFQFDHDWNCYWIHSGSRRPLNDPHKWLFFHHNPDDENPYGTSDLRCVYWPWMFKKAGYEFWLMATEKFSVKTLLAIFEMAGDEEAIRKRAQILADLLQGFVSGSSSAVGNVKEIKEIGMDGHVSEFNALVEACDVQIAYGLTGQSVATNNPENGNRSLGGISVELLYGKAKGIALELQGVLQKAVNSSVVNYFGEGTLASSFEFDIAQRASFQDVMTAVDHGFPVSKSAIYSDYRIPKPKDEDDTFVSPQPSGGFGLSDSDKKKRRMILIR